MDIGLVKPHPMNFVLSLSENPEAEGKRKNYRNIFLNFSMKTLLIVAGLLINSFAFAQQKIAGKWKPVYFSMDKIIAGDIKSNKVILSDTVDVIVKNDKDPAGSKELMQMMAEIMLEKMKNNEQEFLLPNVYTETDKKRNSINKGTFTFDETTNVLIIKTPTKASNFIVSFKNDHLVLTGDLESSKGKKGEWVIEYERL
jgi:hypothetical protein